jgi:hypothetical protein
MPITFIKPRLMRWNSNAITDHNRQPLAISVERIENSHRTANGTLRKWVIADKRTFTTSWEMIPKATSKTVDGFWGGSAIETFFYATTGSFTLEVTDADGTVTNYTVMFQADGFSKEIVKRGTTGVDLWNMSVTLVEV